MLEFRDNFIEKRDREMLWKLRYSVRDPSTKNMLLRLGYISKRSEQDTLGFPSV